MTDQPLGLEEFLDAIRPELEHQVDQLIQDQDDPADRELFRRHRAQILRELIHAVRRRNLEHRLAEAEARLRPRLVEQGDREC